MSDHCCALGFLLLLVACAGVSLWLVSLHKQVDQQVSHILSSLRSLHCGSELQDDVEYVTGKSLFQVPDITSPALCQEKCKQAAKCAAWTWGSEPGVMGLSNMCFLKELAPGEMPKVHERPGVVSGLACQAIEARGESLRGTTGARGVPDRKRLVDSNLGSLHGRERAFGADSLRTQTPTDSTADAADARSTAPSPSENESESTTTRTSTSASSRSSTTTSTATSLTLPPKLVLEQTLFCLSLMMPGSYEQFLLRIQFEQKASIFACDGYAVYSNSSIEVTVGLVSRVVDTDLHCELGGEFNTAMNTDIFMALWEKVNRDGQFLDFAWTIKVDPDTVFFPDRLRPILVGHREIPKYKKAAAGSHGAAADSLRCDVWGDVGDGSCAEVFQWGGGEKTLHECGSECSRYSNCKGIAWSEQDGCMLLGALAEVPGTLAGWQQYKKEASHGVYVNNCKYGLHGPIEIFSAAAVTALVNGREKCSRHFTHSCGGECAWGEDLFIDQCLWKVLGMQRDDVFDLLLEAHCDPPEGWDDCTSESHVAFHPFKDAHDYQECMDSALSSRPDKQLLS